MQVSQTMAYAVHAVLLLKKAEPGIPVSCSQLAVEGGMPERYLLQILRSLVTHGILESVRGVEGGYLLARSLRKVSLLDLSEALHDPLIGSVKLKSELPDESREPFQKALDRVAAAARKELASITLAQLIPRAKSKSRSKARR
jgi:Rrf2 family protein